MIQLQSRQRGKVPLGLVSVIAGQARSSQPGTAQPKAQRRAGLCGSVVRTPGWLEGQSHG